MRTSTAGCGCVVLSLIYLLVDLRGWHAWALYAVYGVYYAASESVGKALYNTLAVGEVQDLIYDMTLAIVTAWILTWPSCLVLGYVLGKGLSAVF